MEDLFGSSQPTADVNDLLNTRAPTASTPSPPTSQEETATAIAAVARKRKLRHESSSESTTTTTVPNDDLSARERIHQTLAAIPYPAKSWRGATRAYHAIKKHKLAPEETKKEDGTRLTRHSESLRRQRQYSLFNDILEDIPCMENPTDVVNGEASIHNQIGALTQVKVYIRQLQNTIAVTAPQLLPKPGMLTLLDLYKLNNHAIPYDTGEIFLNEEFDGFSKSLS